MPFDGSSEKKLVTKASVVLLRASDVISGKRAWNVGGTSRRTIFGVSRCVIGAVRHVVKKYDLCEEEEPLEALKLAAVAHGFASISAFNDHPSTTQRDAIALLCEAAELAKRNTVEEGVY